MSYLDSAECNAIMNMVSRAPGEHEWDIGVVRRDDVILALVAKYERKLMDVAAMLERDEFLDVYRDAEGRIVWAASGKMPND